MHVTADRLGLWTQGIELVALATVGWALFVPGGVVWTTALAAGLIGSGVATLVLVHGRSIASLAQVLARTESEPVLGPTRRGLECGATRHPEGDPGP